MLELIPLGTMLAVAIGALIYIKISDHREKTKKIITNNSFHYLSDTH